MIFIIKTPNIIQIILQKLRKRTTTRQGKEGENSRTWSIRIPNKNIQYIKYIINISFKIKLKNVHYPWMLNRNPGPKIGGWGQRSRVGDGARDESPCPGLVFEISQSS